MSACARRTSRTLGGACALSLSLSFFPAAARAYSDPLLFASPALEAGGAGRYYTGSPADGYGCDTCHRGGEPPELELLGVPTRYVPGASYELTLRWPRALEHAYAVLELTDGAGAGAGELLLPPPEQYVLDELCEPETDGVLAAQLVSAEHGRAIASVPDCGANALRVQWRAPEQAMGPVWLAGGVLDSNLDGDFTGDGVTHFVHAVPAFGAAPEPATQRIAGSCSVRPGAAAGWPASGLAALLASLVFFRARKRSAPRRALLLVLLATGCAAPGEVEPARFEVRNGQAVRPWDAAVPPDGTQDAAVALDASSADAALGPQLAFRVTTLPQGGRYAPKNTGAIWIEDDSGTWLKSLAVWAGVRQRYLKAFGEVNPTRNEVDAVTGATLREHQTHEVSWDLADVAGTAAAPGAYRVVVEVTDRDGPGDVVRVPFELGGTPFVITPEDTQHFAGLELRYEP